MSKFGANAGIFWAPVCIFLTILIWPFSERATAGNVDLTVRVVDSVTGKDIAEPVWKIAKNASYLISGATTKVTGNGAVTIQFKDLAGYAPVDDIDLTVTADTTETCYMDPLSSVGATRVSRWPLWPIPPSEPYDSIVFEPLSFTVVGSDRGYLAWSKSIQNGSFVWGGEVFLADLAASVTSSTSDSAVFPSHRELGYLETVNATYSDMGYADRDVVGVLPQYVPDWVTVRADAQIVELPNQEPVGSWLESWRAFLQGKTKGGNVSHIGDTGHASPTIIYVDNIWIVPLPGYGDYRTYLESVYASEGWGEGILLVPTNEGLLHAFSVGTFEEKWGLSPFPGQVPGYYQEARKAASGAAESPRMNLLDGPLGFGDVENAADGTWRRIVVGTSGTGLTLANKPSGYYGSEFAADGDENTTESLATALTEQYVPKTRNSPCFWGIYAVNLAENDKVFPVSPERPELLWSVSNVYFEEEGVARGSVFVNGIRYDRDNDGSHADGEVPAAYRGFQDIRLSCARPVVGMTRNGKTRKWHVIFVGISHEGEFHLYDLDAGTGEILQDINLGNFSTTLYKDGEGTPLLEEDLSGGGLGKKNDIEDIYWDERFEWKFPTRMGALAKDQVRDLNPHDLTRVDLYRTPLLKEVIIHLSNGALYRWDVSKAPSATNPEMLALSIYGSDYSDPDPGEGETSDVKDLLVAGPSTQDFDGTYLEVSGDETSQYHRFLSLVLKGGDDTNSKRIDMRGMAVIDIDRIAASGGVFLINRDNAWGHGNKDRVEAFDDDMGWFVILAAGDAQEGKFWEEVLTVSAPVFLNGRIVLAGFQPETGTSWIYNVDARQSGGTVITGDEIPFKETEFVGGATISNSGPDGQAVISVGTSSGAVVTQDLAGVVWGSGSGGGGGPASGKMEVLYWKTNH